MALSHKYEALQQENETLNEEIGRSRRDKISVEEFRTYAYTLQRDPFQAQNLVRGQMHEFQELITQLKATAVATQDKSLFTERVKINLDELVKWQQQEKEAPA